VQTCPSCGEENPDRFRLCGICGAKLVPDVPVEEVRRVVTVVFSDLKGSTSLGERLDTESLREVLSVYFTEMKAVLERHGGTVEKFIGDAIMAVFGLPVLHEDDALRAVRAAAEMQRSLVRVNERLQAGWGVTLANRTGVNTGEVVAGDVTAGQRLVTGDTVNTAARLEQAAPEMEVLLGEPTYRLVRDAVEVDEVEPLPLKGKAEPVPAYRLITVQGDEGVARRMDAPMVGRVGELATLEEALVRARASRTGQLVTVFGPAGVGKSRLLREFIAGAGDLVATIRARCLSYGEGITYWPLAEMVKGAAAVADDDPLDQARAKIDALLGPGRSDVGDRLASAIGLSTQTFPQNETFWAARTFVEILAARGPLILVIDDIHWAEPAFLDLIRYVVDTATDAPFVMVCSSRRDLLDDREEWVEERENSRQLVLEPLSAEESAVVMQNLLGTAALDEAVRTRIAEASGGNPLFVEQMLSMMIDDGLLRTDEEGAWVAAPDLGAIAVPPSITALLSSRLDRLGAAQRTVIERGSVIGQTMDRPAVEELVPDAVREQVSPAFVELVRKDLVRPYESTFAGHDAFRFVHGLIRDAAYHRLLKRTRASLHVRFVDWVERVAPDRAVEFEEIRGYHLEQAYLTFIQLGPLDDQARAVGIRGARYLSSAGNRALARGDMHAAASLLHRAAALMPESDPARPRLLLDAGEAMVELGELTTAEGILEGAIERASAVGDRGLETTGRVTLLQMRFSTRGEGTLEGVVDEATRAIEELEELGYHDGLARVWRLLTLVHWSASRYGAAEDAVEEMIRHAELAGDDVMARRFLGSLAICALYGPDPVPEAVARCDDLLRRTRGDRKAGALIMCALAHLEAMQGRFERARDLYRRSRDSFEELGWKLEAALTSIDSGPIELLAGDPATAERELRQDVEALERMGERNYRSTTAAYLAEAVYRQGRYDEALDLTRVSEEIGAEEDVTTQFAWRCVRGKVLARQGRPDQGVALVRQGVALIERTDALDMQGSALLDLGEVLHLAGNEAEAATAIEEAAKHFEAKGNTVSAVLARGLLAAAIPGP
jgi:class 3 adenylate cyclase/tetratricopeptide (TPR) repeat protein